MGSLKPENDAARDEQGVEILDIRVSKAGLSNSLRENILAGLQNETGKKTLPTLLLYNERGLKIFEEITYMDEYYLTNTEIAVLERYAENIAERIEDGGIVVELGSGNLRKVNILLHALDRLGKRITYYALDLDRSELVRTLLMVPAGTFKNVRCIGLHGTYDDGRAWLCSSAIAKNKSRCILWLGSSVGNFNLDEVATFLREWAKDVLRAGKPDCMLIGLDGCKDGKKVQLAYNDPKGLTKDFILNGLWNANKLLGKEYFVPEEWGYIGEWNAEEGRHQAFYEALKDITFDEDFQSITVKKGERINVEYSYKFDDIESRLLWSQSGLMEGAQWSNTTSDYYLHMLYKPSFFFSLGPPSKYAPEPAPTVTEWKELWAAWDIVTLGMIPKEKLLTKPIDLRNPCIFYLGHIPTFLDMHITRATGGKFTAPGQEFQDIFQRGIDPDVDDPTQCHSHSTVPDSWPELEEILSYSRRVRERVLGLYDFAGSVKNSPLQLQRALWLVFEHEAMHLETLLYMLLQSEYSLPPPGVTVPDFVSGRTWEKQKKGEEEEEKAWVQIPKQVIGVGIDDPEDDLSDVKGSNGDDIRNESGKSERYFGWDNEKPRREGIKVPAFKIRAYPITNEEYAEYLYATSSTSVPASWTSPTQATDGIKNGTKNSFEHFLSSNFVKTVFGPTPVALAADWPVIASYDELAECAAWIGGRIPTADEVRAVYRYAEATEIAERTLTKRIDAVNGHLINNGVRESPPPADSLFADLRGRSVGFKNWHPTSVRFSGNRAPLGRCATGGAWEWTSSVLKRHEGFKEGALYPEYTADFFDGKHNIVLGGSWATHPRIAGRRSFVNWYQRNYKYAWATARIAAIE